MCYPTTHYAQPNHQMEKRQTLSLLGPLRPGPRPIAYRRAALPGTPGAGDGADPCSVSLLPKNRPTPQLHTVQTREFGASALFYSLAQELGLIELINT